MNYLILIDESASLFLIVKTAHIAVFERFLSAETPPSFVVKNRQPLH